MGNLLHGVLLYCNVDQHAVSQDGGYCLRGFFGEAVRAGQEQNIKCIPFDMGEWTTGPRYSSVLWSFSSPAEAQQLTEVDGVVDLPVRHDDLLAVQRVSMSSPALNIVLE